MDIKKYKHQIQFIALAISLLLIWYFGRNLPFDSQAIQDSLARFPKIYSGILYVALYIIVTFFVWFSKDLFWLIGAVLFGAALSTLFVWVAEIINAFILFYLARFLGRKFVENYLRGKYNRLDEKIGCLNFSWFFILRAVPLIPYRFLDLGAGLTCISIKRYITAVILGTPIKIFWIQYILAGVGRNVLNNPYLIVEYYLSNKALFGISFIYLFLVIFLAVKFKTKIKG